MIDYYELKIIKSKDLTHTYCMREIKNENNKIILAVAQPDTKSIIFLKITSEYDINEIGSINNIESVPNRKSIMTHFKNNLFIGCKNQIIIIDLNIYKIKNKIYIDSMTYITYINFYLNNKFLLIGLMKNKNTYNYQGYMSQNIFQINSNNEKANIITISIFKNRVHKGNIVDACINNDIIISIGTDNKILLLYKE